MGWLGRAPGAGPTGGRGRRGEHAAGREAAAVREWGKDPWGGEGASSEVRGQLWAGQSLPCGR